MFPISLVHYLVSNFTSLPVGIASNMSVGMCNSVLLNATLIYSLAVHLGFEIRFLN
jgi:hypothetical protein